MFKIVSIYTSYKTSNIIEKFQNYTIILTKKARITFIISIFYTLNKIYQHLVL